MRDGFISVATYSPVVHVADCAFNGERVREGIEKARDAGARLVVFPELCLSGSSCGDLFLQQVLQEGVRETLLELVSFSRGFDMVMVLGAPLAFGSRLYDCAVVLFNGRILGVPAKRHIPGGGRRWFSPGPEETEEVSLCRQVVPFGGNQLFSCTTMREFVFAVEIGEDLLAPRSPSIDLAIAGATVIVNPSASEEVVGGREYRRSLVETTSARLVAGYIRSGAGFGESSTDLVFAGHNLICENGTVLGEQCFESGVVLKSEIDCAMLSLERKRLAFFGEGASSCRLVNYALPVREATITRRVPRFPFVPSDEGELDERCATILKLQSLGLEKRLVHIHGSHVIVGLSGGLDSTLALLVCVRAFDHLALDRKGILAVTMPGFGTTKRTKGNATKLARALGTSLEEIDIREAVRQHFRDIGQEESVTDVTYENSQARERTQILMDLANKRGALVIGTGDLSELALGWATYNGDHMSMYGVNCSVPKTLVRSLVRFAARAEEEKVRSILLDVVATPVSPELLPAGEDGTITQVTEDIVGPYDLHDFFLYHVVRRGYGPEKIFRLALIAFEGVHDRSRILKWLKNFYKRFFSQQFKRSCLPDGPKVGSVSLSPRLSWEMPSDAEATLWMERIEKLF